MLERKKIDLCERIKDREQKYYQESSYKISVIDRLRENCMMLNELVMRDKDVERQ